MADDGFIDNNRFTDQYSVLPFDETLTERIQFHEIRDGHGLNSRRPGQDYYYIELYNDSGRLVEMKSFPIHGPDSNPYIEWVGSPVGVKIDTLGLVAETFGRSKGRYTIQISGFRNYLWEEESRTVEDSDPDGEPVRLADETSDLVSGFAKVIEISDTRTEIRVAATDDQVENSFDEFISRQGQHVMPPGGKDTEFGNQQTDPDADFYSVNRIWPVTLRYNVGPTDYIDMISPGWVSDEFSIVPSANLYDDTGMLNPDITIRPEDTIDTVIFKLPVPVSPVIRPGTELEILRPLFIPFVLPVLIDIPSDVEFEGEEIRGPNMDIPVDVKTGRETILKSFDDLTGTDVSVKKKIVDEFLSGSNDITINYDFSDYKNFIHFSSAEERLKNFKYKLEQIEAFNSKSANVSSDLAGLGDPDATGSNFMLSHKKLYESKRDNIISSFDDYEKHLYFESSSTETIGGITYVANTWPKKDNTKSAGTYTLFATSESAATTWYSEQLESASLYDSQNMSMLRNTIPAYVRSDTQNSQYELFYDMIGQHFDEMYNVITSLEKSTRRHESLDIGLSKDLIYDTAKSLGWTLQSGFDSGELWSYLLGTDSTGSYNNTGATFVKQESKSHSDIEKQTWKRIINNMPYLLKTKGTKRGLKALIATYGIPSTILRVDEFGGPRTTTTSERREIEKFTYALNVSGSQRIETNHHHFKQLGGTGTADSLTTTGSYTRTPSMYECRIDTSFKQSGSMIAASAVHGGSGPQWEVILEHSSSAATDHIHHDYGRLVFRISSSAGQPEISASTDYAPFFDNDWWNISFGVTEHPYKKESPLVPASQSFTVRYAKMGEHADRITHSGSATVVGNSSSYSGEWSDPVTMNWFGKHPDPSTNPDIEGFSGSVQEIRGWAEYLSDDAFYQHTMAPTSIVGDTIQMGYNDLLLRLPLGTDGLTYNHSESQAGYTVTSSIPNSANLTWTYAAAGEGGKFVNFTDSIPYSPKSETYYVDVPHTAGPRATSNKVRIETTRIRGNQLSRFKSFESSSHDNNALDSDEITVALSPADQIDTDISMKFGGFALADYIGDPRDTYLHEYTSLRDTKNLYFKKYSSAYNVWAFLKLLNSFNTGLFRQIESLLPARADATVGIIIRPNILERHKLNQPVSMSQETMYYTGSIPTTSSVSSDMRSQQYYENSYHGTFTAPIEIGVRSSQQGASGSNTYINRFDEGSEYLTDVFGETTMSSVQVYVSESRRMRGGSSFIQIPTYNVNNKPEILNSNMAHTGSGWLTCFNDNFTSFPQTTQTYGKSNHPRTNAWRVHADGGDESLISDGSGLQLGNDNGNDEWWISWNNPIQMEPHSLYRISMTYSQSADSDGDGTTYFGIQTYIDGKLRNTLNNPSIGSNHYIGLNNTPQSVIPLGSGLRTYIAYFHSNDFKHIYSGVSNNDIDKRNIGDIEGIGIKSNYSSSEYKTKITEFAPMAIFNYNDKDGQVRIKNMKVEVLPKAYVDVQPSYISSPAHQRLIYEGVRVTSDDFNVSSPDTIDGGAAVEYVLVNPNTVIVGNRDVNYITNQVIDRRFTRADQPVRVRGTRRNNSGNSNTGTPPINPPSYS